jgi:hypothetical protein
VQTHDQRQSLSVGVGWSYQRPARLLAEPVLGDEGAGQYRSRLDVRYDAGLAVEPELLLQPRSSGERAFVDADAARRAEPCCDGAACEESTSTEHPAKDGRGLWRTSAAARPGG